MFYHILVIKFKVVQWLYLTQIKKYKQHQKRYDL